MSAKVQIYTSKWCGYCTSALALLDKKGIEFEQIDTSGNQAMRAKIARESGQGTVPQIFIDGKSIGGYTELSALDRRGELDKMVRGDEGVTDAK